MRVIALTGACLSALAGLTACRPAAPDGAPAGPGDTPTVSVTLAWDPPATDAAGGPLADLAGYRLYFGTESPLAATSDTFVSVGLAGSRTLSGLAPGTWFFAISAVDESGNESALSAELRAELRP